TLPRALSQLRVYGLVTTNGRPRAFGDRMPKPARSLTIQSTEFWHNRAFVAGRRLDAVARIRKERFDDTPLRRRKFLLEMTQGTPCHKTARSTTRARSQCRSRPTAKAFWISAPNGSPPFGMPTTSR